MSFPSPWLPRLPGQRICAALFVFRSLRHILGAVDDAKPYLEHNRALWDEWATINARSDFYDLPSFRKGGIRLHEFEVEEVGPVEGRSLLHLQCHIGTDTLSWARLGARVTGVDFSERALEEARSLADASEIEARYVLANVYDAADAL